MIDWRKFVTTEFIAFAAVFVVSTIALFSEPPLCKFTEWGPFVLGAAVTLGAIRSYQKKITNGSAGTP